MRLLLNSRGLETETGSKQIYKIIKGDYLICQKIFIIALPENEQNEMLKKNCIKMGFKDENIFFSGEGLPKCKIDFIYVSEENVFELLYYIRKQGLNEYINRQRLSDITYIGSGAGAIIAGKDIKFALDFYSNYIGVNNYKGLELLEGLVFPHYSKSQMKRYLINMDYELLGSSYIYYNIDNNSVLSLDVCTN